MYSSGDSQYNSTLVSWDVGVPLTCRRNVVTALKSEMGEITWAAFYSTADKVMLHIASDGAFNRNCFQLGQSRKGGNVLLACEVPVPWTR